eukprot:g11811.t1
MLYAALSGEFQLSGYGDIHPRSDRERVYAIVAMIFGATMFGYIIGSIAALAGQERGIEAMQQRETLVFGRL